MPIDTLLKIAENRLLTSWATVLNRRPDQKNRFMEADAELVPLPDSDNLLAITTDTVAEEIAVGFYTDPETIGWMGATTSLSDLAAVGASPLGLVVSVNLPHGGDEDFQKSIARGLDLACASCDTFVLGGDTNFADATSITSTAVGLVNKGKYLSRMGCKPGDRLFVSGKLGAGGAAAARAFFPVDPSVYKESDYRPRARVKEGQILGSYASACMDTSDGLLETLDQLMRLNGVGFQLDLGAREMLEDKTGRLSKELGLSPLLFVASHHGEFELAFTIPPGKKAPFELDAHRAGFFPLEIGRVTQKPAIFFAGQIPLETERIRNLLSQTGNDMGKYIEALFTLIQAQETPQPK